MDFSGIRSESNPGVNMSGDCSICGDHCLECRCGKQRFGCEAPVSMIQSANFKPVGYMPLAVEKINHPSHYQSSNFEVIDIIEDFHLGFCLGNAIKYILRAGKKGDRRDDLKKAIWYLERELEREIAEGQ